MQDILAWKKQIRNEMKERRQKMTSTEVEQLSGQVRQRLEELNPIQNAQYYGLLALIMKLIWYH